MPGNSAGTRLRRWFGWWYLCIGIGFLMLAVHRWIIGEPRWLVGLRVVIGGGFLLLGYLELSSKLRRR